MALTRPIGQPEPDAPGIPPQNGDASRVAGVVHLHDLWGTELV